MFERQVYVRDGAGRSLPRVENGERGVVVSADSESSTVAVRLPLREVEIDAEHLDALRLGYAQHVYSAQGRTVEEVYAVIGGWQTSERSAYVGISRARGASWVISDYSSLEVTQGYRARALAELAERCGQSPDKVAAVSLLDLAEGSRLWAPIMTEATAAAETGSGPPLREVGRRTPPLNRWGPTDILAGPVAVEIDPIGSSEAEIEPSL